MKCCGGEVILAEFQWGCDWIHCDNAFEWDIPVEHPTNPAAGSFQYSDVARGPKRRLALQCLWLLLAFVNFLCGHNFAEYLQ